MKKYYYDVVASICSETNRTDSHLVCGGFNTKEEAVDYINKNGISEVDYYKYCNDDETAYIEIEERDENRNITDVVTVDCIRILRRYIMEKIYEYNEPYQGRKRAYLIETERYGEYEIGYYEQKEYSIDYIKMQRKSFSLYFAVRSDGQITAIRDNLDDVKEIVNQNLK